MSGEIVSGEVVSGEIWGSHIDLCSSSHSRITVELLFQYRMPTSSATMVAPSNGAALRWRKEVFVIQQHMPRSPSPTPLCLADRAPWIAESENEAIQSLVGHP